MMRFNAQGTLWNAFATGREAIPLLRPMQNSVEGYRRTGAAGADCVLLERRTGVSQFD
jgi:hypothetical protein